MSRSIAGSSASAIAALVEIALELAIAAALCHQPIGGSGCRHYLDNMQIFVFVSDVEPRLQAISHDPTGDNLPASVMMAWRHQSHGHTTTIDSLSNDLSDAIRRNGFVLMIADDAPKPAHTVH
jgi:hypothetical protein